MGNTKDRLHVRLKSDTIESIKTIACEKDVSQADAITLAIDHYYAERKEEYAALKRMVAYVIDEKMESMIEKINKLQVTGNVIDRDTKILLEFMNHYYLVNKFKDLVTTDKYKTEGLRDAEDLIQKRIHKQRKKKLDYEKRKEQERL
ncbi:hypothetical protein CFK37_03790 [Virgibacillus phasianinus]|uniref:Uncharacterized protein n=1 Tax=Virgibacillus phasianinus TaxID=2017483 RepID=A0A220U026_9BACI|nr:hypothetical protein [Virgibacillus phasianinus]ASK61355.1 hypothetical protein CFK37_03790 [Virgibacillus phasianinus]